MMIKLPQYYSFDLVTKSLGHMGKDFIHHCNNILLRASVKGIHYLVLSFVLLIQYKRLPKVIFNIIN